MPNNKLIYFDTETCGLHGPIVLYQQAIDDGPVELYHFWTMPINEVMGIIENLVDSTVIAFNLAFDWFHICQMYTTLTLMSNKSEKLINCIEEYAINEEKGRYVDLCLKPKHCFDVFLHARKTKYQSTMNRKPIKIRKVPAKLAYPLAQKLTEQIPLSDLYFTRKSDPTQRWVVRDRKVGLEIDKDFRDVVLEFAPSSGLKALAYDALKHEDILKFKDIGVPKELHPEENGYAPFALSVGLPGYWQGAWPSKIEQHISFWKTNNLAIKYATDDVIFTKELYKHFESPTVDDNDSVLAALVGAVRWRGFNVNISAIKSLKDKAEQILNKSELDFNRPIVCRQYIYDKLSKMEITTLHGSTDRKVLESLEKWTIDELCPKCEGMVEGCNCNGGLIKGDEPHPVAIRASEILKFRELKKEVELYDKLITARRFHASFKVIGTLSGRMAGADGLNPQGIKHAKFVRECFPLADEGFSLCGGDFDGFEVTILDADCKDPKLHKELLSGKKIHGLWGSTFFSKSYDEILATSDLAGSKNLYARSKNGVFALIYGGEEYTLMDRLGISEDVAKLAYERTKAKYKSWAARRDEITKMFCTMQQPGGIGSKVVWSDPIDYIESMFEFRRYFTLENKIAKVLYDLSNNPPKEWLQLKLKVIRRDREQQAGNAVRSALLGSAFAIQGSNMRAGANHIIQSAGATLTKQLECDLWELQPKGIHNWIILPLNIHDEVMAPTRNNVKYKTKQIVDTFIKKYSKYIPLIGMDWHIDMLSWADK